MNEDNVVDLDEYRKHRIAEGTWPPNELTVVDYWRSRRGQGQKLPEASPKAPTFP